ncbi:adenylyltransferase/cytidyltransferase family protein [Acetatifactor muris]|uniref:adenylyltransferase/cytidyltransferase family protein n=1 Tax=Acetatifactor muris TaxID=879566 RepID=UPI0023EFBB1C|nr:adenylyltransferase/cytidyltransferase family protein [Acetatifactor muris]
MESIGKRYKIGYTDGVYDLFHVGHLNMIETAKKNCEYLIVGVHSDEVVHQYKHRYPIIPEEERARIVGAVKGVDRVVINEVRDKLTLLERYHFDVVFIGDDWKGTERWNNFEKILGEQNVDVIYVPYTKGISTTDIRKKILDM